MGEERVTLAKTNEDVQEFVKHVLKDLRAMEKMLDDDWFETEPIRIGAEQEMCLVDEQGKAFPKSLEALKILDNKNYTTELALFNMELNMAPLEFKGDCLSQMEYRLQDGVEKARQAVQTIGGDIILTGILPTIRKSDVDMVNLTPKPRYKALLKAIDKLRGKEYELRIQGMDELLMKFNSPLLEACNTGFQAHLQVTPGDFVNKYNISQAISGPVLAPSVNSPMLFGKRLWAETRIALFHQSIDTRQVGEHLRDSSPRVTFGNRWVDESILEIYREDIARYRVMLSSNIKENVEQMIKDGVPPQLMALQVHNSTVYRWNRPCYGVGNGKPHLRVENRVFPSGPTVVDEVANTAFWLGLLNGIEDAYGDITQKLDFDNARMNFFAASKMGMDTRFLWVDDKKVTAHDLIVKELLPIAREGLEKQNINDSDIDTYLEIIEGRVESAQTGSYWAVKSYGKLLKEHSKEQSINALTAAMIKNQKKGEPVHKWGAAQIQDYEKWRPSSLLVEEFMTTDLFTAQKDDIIELVANLLDWRKIRYIPVEDDKKHLVGLVTMRMLLREFVKAEDHSEIMNTCLRDIMIDNPITIHPEASILEAMNIMESQKIGCLPVVKNNQLIGIITEGNFMDITGRMIKVLSERRIKKDKDGA